MPNATRRSTLAGSRFRLILSYTGLRTLYGKFTNNETSTNLTTGDAYINAALRQIYGSASWDYLERTATDSTIAGAGTGTLDSLGSTVSGTGTAFTTELQVGDQITASSQTVTVATIAGPTSLTTVPSFSPVLSGATFTRRRIAYNLPYDYDKLIAMTITIGSTQYISREVADKITWDYLNQNTQITSNIANYYFILNGQLLIWPIPSSSGNTITYTYRRKARDLSMADYTTGTVAVTSGFTTVTGTGTTWRRGMVGQWLRITANNTSDATSGDGEWYRIRAVSSTTSIILEKAYSGPSVAGGSYTIGEMPLLPENYHQMPVYQSAAWYWTANENPAKAKMFQDLYDANMKQLRDDHLSKTTDDTINEIESGLMRNPNLYILS